MSMKQKIFQSLIENGNQRTAAQLAAQLGTTKNAVAARISEIRDEGHTIRSLRQTDSSGRTKYFYVHDLPTLGMVAAGRQYFKLIKSV